MGTFKVTCRLAQEIATAYRLGKPERTTIQYSGEYRFRDTRSVDIPVLDITGNKVGRWIDFTQRFQPVRR